MATNDNWRFKAASSENLIWLDSHSMRGKVENDEGKKISLSWFRGDHCNYMPSSDTLKNSNSAFSYVLKGWLPNTPLISKTTKITAFGSCFAANITNWLNKRNFSVLTGDKNKNAYVVQCGDGMVTTFAIRQQFEWALENKEFSGELWHGKDKHAFEYDEDIKKTTRDLFLESDLFVITLGLSEVWYDSVTSDVFWRAIPEHLYDATRHKFRVSTVAENKTNIQAIFDVIKKHKPEAKVIFTLSPIPLAATFRAVSCITANSVSKSILRAALDEFYMENNIDQRNDLYYWPSYEIVTQLFTNAWLPDGRHVRPEILDFIMTLFETYWCQGSEPERTVQETWAEARFAAGSLPMRFKRLSIRGDKENAEILLSKIRKVSEEDASQLIAWAKHFGARKKMKCASWFD